MFDAHTHLNGPELYPQRKPLLQDFIDAGGTGLINIGVNHEYNTNGITICKDVDFLPSSFHLQTTIGIHPYEVACSNITASNIDEELNKLYNLYNSSTKPYIVAIGEIGIDTYRPDTDHTLDLQKKLFGLQCQWARDLRLPIVIHTRANRPATHEVLQDFTDLTIYFHCRSYTPAEIKIIQGTYPDFYIGITGVITYPKAIDIRKSLRYLIYNNEDYPNHLISGKIQTSDQRLATSDKKIKTKNLLIETDAPYLPPVPYRGKQNNPAYIIHTYDYISALLGYDITTQVIENAKRCYRL